MSKNWEKDSIKIGQIGLGHWGRNILRNLHELGVLAKACDIDQKVISEHKKNYPYVDFTTDYEEVIRDKKIDAVVISTPAVTHYELVIKALNEGKDVFVEKPLALRLNEAEEAVEIAERKNKILMVGHILQYHPAIKKLKEKVKSGEIGKIQYIYSNRLNIGRLRTEENILWSFAPHDISAILSIVDEEPERVWCFGGDFYSRGVHDVTVTAFDFPGDIKCHIFVSWLHPYKEQKLIVIGSKSMIVFDDISEEKLFIYPHKIEWKEGKIPVASKEDFIPVPCEKAEPLKEEMKHFIECVGKRRKPITDGTEGIKVLKLLELAERSLREGRIIELKEKKQPEKIRGEEKQKIYSEIYPNVFIHESSFIDENVSIGEGTKIWHFSHILQGSKIGKNCVIGQNVMIGPDVVIGNRCKIQNNVSVYKGVKIEDDVFLGPSCVFTNVYNPRAFIERKNEFRETIVKRGVTIGANATIVCGVTIGEYALVGAGAVVRENVPPHALVVGVPAKQIGWACFCGTTLTEIKERLERKKKDERKHRSKNGNKKRKLKNCTEQTKMKTKKEN